MELFCTENYVPICYLHSSLAILSKMNYDYDYYMPIECGILFVWYQLTFVRVNVL